MENNLILSWGIELRLWRKEFLFYSNVLLMKVGGEHDKETYNYLLRYRTIRKT